MGSKHGNHSSNRSKSGNDSGSDVKEARGPSYESSGGKHPPNEIHKGPKDLHPRSKQDPDRHSQKG
jgi:hypothetical protein